MKIKYVRVSTQEQNTGRQEVNSQSFIKIYVDHVSGSVPFAERKEGKKLLADVEAGSITEFT